MHTTNKKLKSLFKNTHFLSSPYSMTLRLYHKFGKLLKNNKFVM